jgi:hypothetical protein
MFRRNAPAAGPDGGEARSELLGMEERVDQVDGETAGHDTAEDEIQHWCTQALSTRRA